MKPVQALLSGRGGCPARREYGSGSRLGGLERGMPAAMKETGIVEAGHDGHESIKSRVVFRHPSFARFAERRNADLDHMREGRLCLAAGANCAKSQSGAFTVAQRTGCKPVRQPRERGRVRRNPGCVSIGAALSSASNE
jgi:hypothetical protein